MAYPPAPRLVPVPSPPTPCGSFAWLREYAASNPCCCALLLLFGFLVFLPSLPLVAEQELPRRVILVSVDGLEPITYIDPEARQLKVPTLRRLAAEGAYASGLIGVLPSVTYPSHTTLITGVTPRLHGIGSNKIFDPQGLSDGSWYWWAEDILVPTLVSAAEGQHLETASVAWPVSVGLDADHLLPEFWNPGSQHPNELRLLDALSSPGLRRAVEGWRDEPFPYPYTDAERLDTALYLTAVQRPELLLLHLIDTDKASHDEGPGSAHSNRAVEQADARLGQLLDALKESALPGQELLFVVASDHGFLSIDTRFHPNVVLAEAGLLETDDEGKISSWRVYAHTDAGSAQIWFQGPGEKELVEHVRELFIPYTQGPDAPLEQILGADRIRELGGIAESPLVLDAAEGFTLYDNAAGEKFTPSRSRGTHGYAPDRSGLAASLLIWSPTLKRRGDLGEVSMTQIAPTIADWLGLSLDPRADDPLDLWSPQTARTPTTAALAAGP
ncbi:MAG: ectonucleotide pyrophosphatase/phosphodiesterase [Acidobacteriota bacterium]